MFVIKQKEQNLYWTENGWTQAEEATLFFDEDRPDVKLPPESYWCPLYSVDEVQFIRLLYESQKNGLFNQQALSELAERMHCEPEQVSILIDRARTRFLLLADRILNKGVEMGYIESNGNL